ncbi:hypothetical protein Tco_1269994 [Tanacetum coccineum]
MTNGGGDGGYEVCGGDELVEAVMVGVVTWRVSRGGRWVEAGDGVVGKVMYADGWWCGDGGEWWWWWWCGGEWMVVARSVNEAVMGWVVDDW